MIGQSVGWLIDARGGGVVEKFVFTATMVTKPTDRRRPETEMRAIHNHLSKQACLLYGLACASAWRACVYDP